MPEDFTKVDAELLTDYNIASFLASQLDVNPSPSNLKQISAALGNQVFENELQDIYKFKHVWKKAHKALAVSHLYIICYLIIWSFV